MSLGGRFAVGGLAQKGMGPAPSPMKGEGLAPKSKGVGARDSTTTDGPPRRGDQGRPLPTSERGWQRGRG